MWVWSSEANRRTGHVYILSAAGIKHVTHISIAVYKLHMEKTALCQCLDCHFGMKIISPNATKIFLMVLKKGIRPENVLYILSQRLAVSNLKAGAFKWEKLPNCWKRLPNFFNHFLYIYIFWKIISNRVEACPI